MAASIGTEAAGLATDMAEQRRIIVGTPRPTFTFKAVPDSTSYRPQIAQKMRCLSSIGLSINAPHTSFL
jgi:hypothetical protein